MASKKKGKKNTGNNVEQKVVVKTGSSKIKNLSEDVAVTRRWNHYGSLIIFLFSFLLYANTIPNDYCVDDSVVTGQNALVKQGLKAIPQILTSPYYTYKEKKSEYRPIAKISFAIESQFFGDNPHVSHLIQTLLYAFICVILFGFLQDLFSGLNIFLPFIATLLFAAHPIHSEVVANLKNREELFAFLFSLLFIQTLVKALAKKKTVLWLLAVLYCLLALMSKQSSFVILLWAPLIIYFSNKTVKLRTSFITTAALLVFVITYTFIITKLILNYSVQESIRTYDFVENPLAENKNILLQLGVAFNCLGFYLLKLLFPHPLGWYYGYNMFPLQMPWEIKPLIFFLIHLILFVWAVIKIRSRNVFAFSILLYLFAIAPYLNFPTLFPGIVAERASFFASLGFCIALALILMMVSQFNFRNTKTNAKPLFCILFIPLVILYSAKTYSRNRNWKNPVTLYQSDLKYLKNSYKENLNFADELFPLYRRSKNQNEDIWMLQKSLALYKQANEIFPNTAKPNARIGEILFTEYSKYEEATPYLKKAIALEPNNGSYYFNLAYCYTLQQKYEPAIVNYKIAMRLDTTFIASWLNLAALFSEMGLQDSAIVYNKAALQKDPDLEIGNANMGFLYKNKGDFERARYYFKKALAINPNRRDVVNAMAEMK